MDSTWEWPGSRWWRVDLHAHTPASHDFKSDEASAGEWSRRWIESARAANLDAVAITDHNSSESVRRLQDAAYQVDSAPVLFPGVELTASDRSHLLLVLDTSATQAHIDDLLSRMEVRVDARGAKTARTSLSVEQILDRCDDQMLVIAAHANRREGLLNHRGEQRISELGNPRLAAVEIHPDCKFDSSWLDGSKPEVGRTIPQVWASDSHSFENLGERYTWLKMTEPSLEGLRLALSDGNESLKVARRGDTGEPNTYAERVIEKIRVYETKYIGRASPTQICFNPWLNAIIGARGTGKSTLLDLLRKTLRRDSELESSGSGEEGSLRAEDGSLRSLFDSRMQVPASRLDGGLLLGESRVEVVYRKDGERFLLSWSQDGSAHPIARLSGSEHIPEEGNILERFPVRLYSQKQLFSLAQNPNALLAVLDDAQEVGGTDCRRELMRLESRYLSLRAEARTAIMHASELPGREAILADTQRKLDILQQGGHAEVLRLYRSLRQIHGTWRAVLAATEKGLNAVGDAVEAVAVPELGVSTDDDGDEATEALNRAYRSLHQLVDGFRNKALENIDEVRRELGLVVEGDDAREWDDAVRASEDAYGTTFAQLEEQGIADPTEYGELVERARMLTVEIDALGTEGARALELERKAHEVLAEYREIRRQLSVRRQRFARDASGDTLDVNVVSFAAHENLADDLGTILGIKAFQEDRRSIAERIRIQESDDWTWGGLDSVVDDMREFQAGQPDSWDTRDARFLRALRALPPEGIDRLALYLPEDVLEVRFRSSGTTTDWRPMAQGSPGQQTAALLAFVLGFGSEPIVLDQPEDDLDSTLIYELLVRRFRETKPTRQLILVTHNPNIVVHGDAELVLSLEVRDSQTAIRCKGGLQEETVREEICRVMEGGREAFESRYNRIMPMLRLK